MSGPASATRRGPVAAVVAVVVLLAASAVSYWLLLTVQRNVFLDGVPAADPHAFPRPVTDQAAIATAQTQYLPLAAAGLLLYLVVLVLVRWSRGRAVGVVAVVAGVLGHLGLVLTSPTLSIDLYSYIAHGYLAATPGSNPYVTMASDVADTPVGQALLAQGWTPVHPQTPYGPLWTQIERLAVLASASDVSKAALILKAVVAVATIGTGLLAWVVANKLRPGAGPLAATAWLLNPVVVMEFGVEGHNDAVAIFLTVLALLTALQGWALIAVLALAGATLVKWLPAAFAFPVLLMLVGKAEHPGRRWLAVGVGVVVSVAAAWWLWSPWWVGLDTLAGLRSSATPYPAPSPAGWLVQVLADPSATEPSLTPPLLMIAALLVVSLAAGWGRQPSSWLVGCAVIAVAILAISPVYWPWYSALPIAVLALRPTGIALCQIAVLTAGSRFVALWGDLGAVGAMPYDQLFANSALIGLSGPVAACAVLGVVGAVIHGVRHLVVSRRATTQA